MSPVSTGYYSLLRWRPDPTRDEARNVAVILVDETGKSGGIRATSISAISSRLNDQGIIDALLFNLEQQFSQEIKPDRERLSEWHKSLQDSLCLTKPRLTAMPDLDNTLSALYKAYVQTRGGGSSVPTKGRVLDRAVNSLRRKGYEAIRGQYVGEFLFDAVLKAPAAKIEVLEVLSFANPKKTWTQDEHDAGHFLYSLERTGLGGAGIFAPPTATSHESAHRSFDRINNWFDHEGIPWITLDDLQTTDAFEKVAEVKAFD